MCLVISLVCYLMAYMSWQSQNSTAFFINLALGIFFTVLMVRNIVKTRNEKRDDF